MQKCPVCNGTGKGLPTSSGTESSWRINQYLMRQSCPYCKGKKEVSNKRAKLTVDQERLYKGITRD